MRKSVLLAAACVLAAALGFAPLARRALQAFMNERFPRFAVPAALP